MLIMLLCFLSRQNTLQIDKISTNTNLLSIYLHKEDTGDSNSNGRIILEIYIRNVHERLTLKHGFEDRSVERERNHYKNRSQHKKI